MCNWNEKQLLMQSTTWFSWWHSAWGGIIHVDLDLNEEPMEGIDVHDQPTPIVKLPEAYECAHLLSIL